MKWLLLILTLGLIVIHQDFWNWANTRPVLFGFLPIGLWYHALFAVACAVLMGLLVKLAWPKHLESAQPETPEARAPPNAEKATNAAALANFRIAPKDN